MKTSKILLRPDHLMEEDIALYVDALKLDRVGELPAKLLKHVEGCDDCKAKILALHEMMPNEMYNTETKHPYFDRTKQEPVVHYLFTPYRVAAAVAGVALLGAGYYYIATSHSPQTIASRQTQTQSTLSDQEIRKENGKSQTADKSSTKDLLAANFEPSSNLEDLVQNEFRSTSIEALSPVVGKVVSQPITFKWKNYEGQITLKVLTNKEINIFTSSTEASSLTMKKSLSPGLYYWKLETEDELLFVGKFIVK